MDNILSSGGVVINHLNQIILTNTEGVFWTLPKGRIKKNENPLQAARREISEETGITDLKLIKYLGTYKRSKFRKDLTPEPDSWKTMTIFLFSTDQNELKPRDKDILEAKWADIKQVTELLTHPEDKIFFQSLLNKHLILP
jgi:ADP-ribose pyrophosphatase YjhB (NUDIX family)